MKTIQSLCILAVPLSVLLSIEGANAQKVPSATVQPAAVTSAPAAGDVNAALRASAEPFEKLSETAFDASWRALSKGIGDANDAAAKMRTALSPADAARLDAQLSAVRDARQKQDRAALSLSAIEGYRILVSAVTDKAKVPTEVSLLDYAGFRYKAHLKSKPVRWDEMGQAVDFARQTAKSLAPKLPSPELAANVEKIIVAMEQAVKDKNVARAAASVKSELDYVDVIEKAFAKLP
jgi:hypothetical protein